MWLDFMLTVINDMEADVPVRSASISLRKHRFLRPAKTIHTIPVHPSGTGESGSGSRPLAFTASKLNEMEPISCHAKDDTLIAPRVLIGKHSIWLTLDTIGQRQRVRVKIDEITVEPWDLPTTN